MHFIEVNLKKSWMFSRDKIYSCASFSVLMTTGGLVLMSAMTRSGRLTCSASTAHSGPIVIMGVSSVSWPDPHLWWSQPPVLHWLFFFECCHLHQNTWLNYNSKSQIIKKKKEKKGPHFSEPMAKVYNSGVFKAIPC